MTRVSEIFSTSTDEERASAVAAASGAIRRGELVVLPTDTVYGIAADAFDPRAVRALLEAKGRGRDMPPPVLIAAAATSDALLVGLSEAARALMERFWPGPLTIVGRQQQSLQWDLGDTRGTVAVRVPDDAVAREVLDATGPLAVSSANATGRPAATSAADAREQLGDAVSVYLDAGPSRGGEASTIVDVTGDEVRVLRQGALAREQLEEVLAPLGVALTGAPDAGEA